MAGRNKTADPGIPATVNVPGSMWAYVELYNPTGSRSEQVRDVIEFAQAIRPAAIIDGELRFVQHIRKAPRPTVSRPRKLIAEFAQANGLTLQDAETVLIRRALGL